jgi:bisphosphoglycerate-dependent phosphoglycerate mutase
MWIENGPDNWMRFSTRTEYEIPIPDSATSTEQYEGTAANYREGDKDTKSADALEVTYESTQRTFEQDICKSMRIDDSGPLKPTYWY